ncbi:NAD-dependent succinate-semialdehyde dehydrogenase (plasmid) [Deinococcus psychrotolerans]|uniref:NAD-dependent succinate-semialdehyde dehydrogenase n=1 Tax=Deinococcus psychrotolerans TaxID=2489213 RepID=A0A3G8YGN5_9DEIO|nr:NAD-dependent succinate-semialdehyde dehydrogenase [Deinococcus psychrotolerans]AZI44462.1 NAD-dependent succinate-semialdehyde dehydrogenase [Deinococcus psychrotolerans]
MTGTAQPTFDLISPSSGQVIAQIPDQTVQDAQDAVERSVKAFGSWRTTSVYERSVLLRKFNDLMLRDVGEIARLIASEMGKPVTEAAGEVKYAASFLEWYAEEAKRIYGTVVPSQSVTKQLMVTHEPVGPVYAVTPWNFPAAMATRKVGPALAAGCTIILKAAEQSPLTALKMAELWTEAGGPADTFIVLTTSDPVPTTKVMMDDARIRKITFTGSTEVGRLLAAQAAPTLKRVSLELGGHAPYLIFDDADLDQAVADVIACKFRNAGQTCVCVNRVYVQRGIADEFTRKLSEAAAQLKVGDPLDAATQIGPLVDAQGLAKVKRHVTDALSKGATATTGGEAGEGLYFQPTVLSGVRAEMLIMQEETFGPVAPIIVFDTEEEAVKAANDTEFGLAAYLWTNNLSRAFRVSAALEYGIIGLNDPVPSTAQAPFGGVKQSGYGREGGLWGIQEYLTTKYLSMNVK